jgi:5-formyltetrahydrofolate cyclo-ligase
MTAELRSHLRQFLRTSRRALSPRQQRLASIRMYRLAITRKSFHAARHIGFYLPIDGEIDPLPLLRRALKDGKNCYLPVISRSNRHHMAFVRYDPFAGLRINRWGIKEPQLHLQKKIAAWALDLVFVPLTGFDSSCTRMGMGKGYYDRAFQFRLKPGRRKPLLIGLAHECQKRDALPRESWDIPMDEIISDRFIYCM